MAAGLWELGSLKGDEDGEGAVHECKCHLLA